MQMGQGFLNKWTTELGVPQSDTLPGLCAKPTLLLPVHLLLHIHPSTNLVIKTGHGTSVIGLIYNDNNSANRNELCKLSEWCFINNLAFNTSKAKELITSFR